MRYIFVLIAASLLCSASFSQDYYTYGKAAYAKGDYKSAVRYFEAALASSPKNVNYKYYYAQALIAGNDIQSAMTQYKEIIALSPNSNAGRLSKIGIERISQYKSKQSEIIGSNYIERVSENGKYYRFASMPVNVFIEANAYAPSVREAFKVWQEATYGRIAFVFVNEEKDAQIRVYFRTAISQNQSLLEDSEFVAGNSKSYYKNGFIVKSDIFLLKLNPITGKALPKNEVFTTALHEIGHAVGLRGHSDKASDVMSPKRSTLRSLSERDKNTVLLLYR